MFPMTNMFSNVMLLVFALLCFKYASGDTLESDLNYFRSATLEWENTPAEWIGPDPCGAGWPGVYCTGNRISALYLSSMRLKGPFPAEIGYLTALKVIDFSYNPDLSGALPSTLGQLTFLEQLILTGCRFSGSIPVEIGNLTKLFTLDLNSNRMTGSIPKNLQSLTNLYWFDIGNNSVSGTLPTQLKYLVGCGHFHFSKNQLSGDIPPEIFHEKMVIKHVLFDHNQLTGEIPSTIGTLSGTLTALRLDSNHLNGQIPDNITQLTSLNELDLSNNNLDGRIPDLSGLQGLQSVDLSNNDFPESDIPSWFYTMGSLIVISMEKSNLNGFFPAEIFESSNLETLILGNNSIDGNLNIQGSISPNIQKIDLRFNNITDVPSRSGDTTTLLLEGNPVCEDTGSKNLASCNTQLSQEVSYSTNLSQCESGNSRNCSATLKTNPTTCECALPYEGKMVFRAPFFQDIQGENRFRSLENSLEEGLNLTKGQGAVYICCLYFDNNKYLNLELRIFPSNGVTYFNSSGIQRLAIAFSNQTYKPPDEFGPYYFMPDPYIIRGERSTRLSVRAIVGIAVGAALFIILLLALIFWVCRLKKKIKKNSDMSYPFASWDVLSGKSVGDPPKLKGARCFTLEEINLATSKFSHYNEIGSGGYGKVYKGFLPGGDMIAVKRASQESAMQHGMQFKAELELLSRVHHKNLVNLIGFCFEGGEQMLVYEYMPNGSLRETLSGRTGIRLDWRRRLRIALGAAKGLVYLHEHADPPIIHRDVKSSNILLDMNMNAKVSDFGLCKPLQGSETTTQTMSKGHVTTQVKGTLGYLDPEYYMTQQITQKSDVYSFGVVLLELITATAPLERGTYLVREVENAMSRPAGINYVRMQLLDPFLRDLCPPPVTSLEKFIRLALQCTAEASAKRPTMTEVARELEIILEADRALQGGGTDTPSPDTSDFYIQKHINLQMHMQLERPGSKASTFASSSTSSYNDNSAVLSVDHAVEPK